MYEKEIEFMAGQLDRAPGGGVTAAELARACGHTEERAEQIIVLLRNSGIIGRPGHRLPDLALLNAA